MNKLAVLICVIGAIASASAIVELKPNTKIDNSPEAVAKRKANVEKLMREKFGGIVRKPGSLQGKILFANAQQRVPNDIIAKVASDYAKAFKITIEATKSGTVDVAGAKDALKKSGANAVVFIVDSKDIPTTFLVAPDALWSIVNVAALAEDNPKQETLNDRTVKVVGRAFGYTCGAASSQYEGSLLTGMPTLDDIDLYTTKSLPIDAMMRMRPYMEKFGVTQWIQTTYLQACKDGWAPPPTNEWQKAIVEKVSSEKETGPVNGLKITPPKK